MTSERIMVFCTIIVMYSSKYHSAIADTRPSKFDILLNLYKLNPLKESNIYKQFVLQTMTNTESSKIEIGESSTYEADEGIKQRTDLNLKHIEKIIHAKGQKKEEKEKENENYFNINNVESEKFSAFVVTKTPELTYPTTTVCEVVTENFNSLFGHMESDEGDESLGKLNTIETSSTPLAYEENTTITPAITKSLNSIEFYKLTENKDYNELPLPVVNKKIEFNIPINNENELTLPFVNKNDKSEKNENELFLPSYNLAEVKKDYSLLLPYNYAASKTKNEMYLSNNNKTENEMNSRNYKENPNDLNLPYSTRDSSKHNDIMFHSNNKIDEGNNEMYLPIKEAADQKKDEFYLPINKNGNNGNMFPNLNNNDLNENEINLADGNMLNKEGSNSLFNVVIFR